MEGERNARVRVEERFKGRVIILLGVAASHAPSD